MTHKSYLTANNSPTTGEEESSSTSTDLSRLTYTRRRRREGINKRTRRLSATEKRSLRKKTKKHQHRISDYFNCKLPGNQGTGHRIEDKVQTGDIRVYVQNPNGVKSKGAYFDDTVALKQLKQLEVDIIALPETNCNWKHKLTNAQWNNQVKRIWKHAKIFNSSINSVDPAKAYNRGRVSIIVTNKWASRVVDSRTDYLGRWSWVKLTGKRSQNLYCLAMYRPNPGNESDGHLLSVWNQQHQYLQQQYLNKEQIPPKIDPREKCLQDIQQWIDDHITSTNDKLIILTDANQCVTEKTKSLSLQKIISKNRLKDIFTHHHGETWLSSTKRGSKKIDHLMMMNIDPQIARRSGQLPHGIEFESDHRGMFADLDAQEMLYLTPNEPILN